MNAIPWLILVGITLVWYLVVTIIVAIRGIKDIKQLFKESGDVIQY